MKKIILNQPGGSQRRSGFTLIELLIVMVIMGILAGLLMLAISKAKTRAQVDKTKGIITNLDRALMARFDYYEDRRVPISFDESDSDNKKMYINFDGKSGITIVEARLNGIREMMRLEMPDMWSEVTTGPIVFGNDNKKSKSRTRFAPFEEYRRIFNNRKDKDGKKSSKHPETNTFQSAELLYLITTMPMFGEESVRSQFKEDDIADVDEDGFYEFIDAWGKPILFLRWAPGFESPLQPVRWIRKNNYPSEYHDPFDIEKTQKKAYALFPVIYSAGPDGQYDISRKVAGGGAMTKKVANDPFEKSRVNRGAPKDIDHYYQLKPDGVLRHYDNIDSHTLKPADK